MARNKIGICEWALPIDGPYVCKLASELGLDGIQLDIGPYEKGFPKSRKVVQEAWIENAAQYGIEFCSMAARVSDYYSMVTEPGQEEHEIVKSGLEAAIGACKAMQVPRLLVPNFEKSAIRTDRHFEIVTDVLKWACDLAGDEVVIAAENTFSPARTKELFKAVDRGNLGLYFDSQNYFLHNDVYTPDILEELFELMVEIHVKDGRNKDLSGALLGTGAANFEETAAVLRARGYEGWIVTENYYDMPPLCGPDEDPVALIKKDMETLRKTFF